MFRQHTVTLRSDTNILLRPLHDEDWSLLEKWNSDPEVLYFTEGDTIEQYSPTEVRELYETVSQTADIFVIEVNEKAIGECWLQEMNIIDIKDTFRGEKVYRIDLMIGEKEYWGKGYGSEVIGLLTEYGFRIKNGDILFGIMNDYNERSIKAFKKNCYIEYERVKEEPGRKGKEEIRLLLKKDNYRGKEKGFA